MRTTETKQATLSSDAFRNHKLVDKIQDNGRLTPVFPALLSDQEKHSREDAYIARMIARDRNLGW